jgi:hypothetical protein
MLGESSGRAKCDQAELRNADLMGHGQQDGPETETRASI